MRTSRCIVAGVLGVAALVSCGSEERPTLVALPVAENLAPQVNSFRPDRVDLDVFVDDTVLFVVNAVDPEGAPVSITFYLDDVEVANTFYWNFLVKESGPATITAEISDGVNTIRQRWDVQRRIADADPLRVLAINPAATPGFYELTWEAGADLEGSPLKQYAIRSSNAPITGESIWTLGSPRGVFVGGIAPGEVMAADLQGLPPGGEVFVTVRGIDGFGHYSKLGNSVSVVPVGMRVQGEILDAVTGAPLEGILVRFNQHAVTTGADGRYDLQGLAITTSLLIISDESGPEVGDYFDYERLYATEPDDHLAIYLLPNRPIDSSVFADFRRMYLHFAHLPGIPEGFDTRRWELPINIFVPPYTSGGLDYRQTLLDVLADLELVFARDLFTIVDAAPALGVRFGYDPLASRDNFAFEELTPSWYPVRARVLMRTLYQARDKATFETTARHELGHVLGLNHSLDRRHLMIGGQASTVPHFTADERLVIETHYALPRGTATRFFVAD